MLQTQEMFQASTWPQYSQQPRLLIVDDEPHIRSSVARALNLLGYSVEEAACGREALTLLERTPHDLMVLDMRMPGLDGVEVMRQARRLQPELLIIILTGYASIENAIAAVKSQAADYLRKPVSTREIADVVRQTLRRRAQELRQQQLVHILTETVEAFRQDELPSPSSPPRDTPSTPSNSGFIYSKNIIQLYPLTLDCHKRLVTATDKSDRPIKLTKGETAVLASLMTNPDQVLSNQELVHLAWGDRTSEDEAKSIIRPCISRLRHKIEVDPKNPRLICTVRRHGYHFVSP